MAEKVMIAMSGGVDSAVAACLLKEQGFDCVGATMRLWEGSGDGGESTCCSLADVEDARAVAYTIGIPHHVFNFSPCFHTAVVEPFIAAYEAGRTPNPCIDCNRFLKFGELLRRAMALGCEKLATGHYARITREADGSFLLRKGADPHKDQSYVLCRIPKEALPHLLFPLGGLTKNEVRALAAARGFVNAEKKDSQDICFVPDGDYASFLEATRGSAYPAGDFVDSDGKILGRHRGIVRYTPGQRRGLGLSAPAPLYVISLDPLTNTVVLGPEQALYTDTLIAHDISFLTEDDLTAPRRLWAKVRYAQKEQPVTALRTGADEITVHFDTPQRAITKGQTLALYDDDIVIGGGVIG